MGRPLIFVTAGKLANENLGGMLMKALVFHGPKKKSSGKRKTSRRFRIQLMSL